MLTGFPPLVKHRSPQVKSFPHLGAAAQHPDNTRHKHSPQPAEGSENPPLVKRRSGGDILFWSWQLRRLETMRLTSADADADAAHRWIDGRVLSGQTDRAAARTGMNESLRRRVSADIRSGAAGVPDTLTGLLLRRVGARHNSDLRWLGMSPQLSGAAHSYKTVIILQYWWRGAAIYYVFHFLLPTKK